MNTTPDTQSHLFRWNDLVDSKLLSEDQSFNFLVPKIETYYRSKAFVSQININPLIAASAPLLFLIEKIQGLYKAPDTDKLHDDFMHEIHAFEHQSQTHGYRSYVISAARYVLCLWVDQTVFCKPWGENCQWEKTLSIDYPELEQENSFYLLVNRCLQEPAIYLDLLELFYLCLSLGFQGNVHASSEANQTNRASEVRDYLFEIISKQRQGFSKRLEVDVSTPTHPTRNRFLNRSLLRTGIAIFMALFLIASYTTLDTRLETPMNGMQSFSSSSSTGDQP